MNIELIEQYGDDFMRRMAAGAKRADSHQAKTERGPILGKRLGAIEAAGETADEAGGQAEALRHIAFYQTEGIIAGTNGASSHASGGQLVKPGKEACVWRFPGNPGRVTGDVAVKLYKDIETRSFRDLAGYLEGRLADAGMNRRDMLHLLSSPSRVQGFWVQSEYAVLAKLHGAGLPVPQPYASDDTSLAMEFIADADGEAAPRLTALSAKAMGVGGARTLEDEILEAIRGMLRLNLVHGDLSPYNVLVRGGKAMIIDFPQAVDARFNRSARDLLKRDVGAIVAHFRGKAAAADEAKSIADSLWWEYAGER